MRYLIGFLLIFYCLLKPLEVIVAKERLRLPGVPVNLVYILIFTNSEPILAPINTAEYCSPSFWFCHNLTIYDLNVSPRPIHKNEEPNLLRTFEVKTYFPFLFPHSFSSIVYQLRDLYLLSLQY